MRLVLFRLDPILLDLGFLQIHWYGVCVALALLALMFTLQRLGKGTGRTPDHISNLLTVIVIASLVGARAAYVLEHWTQGGYASNPLAIFNITQGGFMFYGGLLLSGLALIIFAHRHRERLLGLYDLILTALPLSHAIGRVGCFLQGCCFGRLCDNALGVTYPPRSHAWDKQFESGLIARGDPTLPVYPSQLIEAAANLLIFAILLFTWRRRKHEGTQTALYLALYATARFFLETLRFDTRLRVGPFTIGQAISLALLALAAALFLRAWRRSSDRM